jgi:hypothetical protein
MLPVLSVTWPATAPLAPWAPAFWQNTKHMHRAEDDKRRMKLFISVLLDRKFRIAIRTFPVGGRPARFMNQQWAAFRVAPVRVSGRNP